MKGFSLPKATDFAKQAGNFQELTGKGVASFLKGLGIDLTQVVPIAQAMFGELEKLNDRLERIELAIAAVPAIRADLDALGEIVRETVPEAAVSIGEYEKTLRGDPIAYASGGEHGHGSSPG